MQARGRGVMLLRPGCGASQISCRLWCRSQLRRVVAVVHSRVGSDSVAETLAVESLARSGGSLPPSRKPAFIDKHLSRKPAFIDKQ